MNETYYAVGVNVNGIKILFNGMEDSNFVHKENFLEVLENRIYDDISNMEDEVAAGNIDEYKYVNYSFTQKDIDTLRGLLASIENGDSINTEVIEVYED